jgi:hypothetical protein
MGRYLLLGKSNAVIRQSVECRIIQAHISKKTKGMQPGPWSGLTTERQSLSACTRPWRAVPGGGAGVQP